jgi:hypothetical protein
MWRSPGWRDGVLTANDHDLDRAEVRIAGSAAVVGQRVQGHDQGRAVANGEH